MRNLHALLDSVNNFDQLKTYRDFEAKFLGFTSERSTIENLETNWLNNDRTGIDPDSVDLAIDNSEMLFVTVTMNS